MKRLFLTVCLLGVAASVAWAQPGRNPGADKTRAAYEKATTAGNVTDLVALYTADAVVMPPDMPMVRGKAAVEAFHKKNVEMFGISNLKITPTNSEAVGDTVVEIGTYSQTITPKGGGGAPINDAGKYVVVLKKQGDVWKLAYEIYNSDKPVPMPPPAATKK